MRLLNKKLKCPKCGNSYSGSFRLEKLYKSIYLNYLKGSNEIRCYLCNTTYIYPELIQKIFKYVLFVLMIIVFITGFISPLIILLQKLSFITIVIILITEILVLSCYYYCCPVILSYIAYFCFKKKIK